MVGVMEIDEPFDMLPPDRLLSEILFMGSSGGTNVILFVEGDTDETFFKSFVCSEIYIRQVDGSASRCGIDGGNKNRVIETIKKANNEGIKGIVGIVDADFDHLDTIPSVENLYRTDTHDLESMLIKSEKALKKVLIQYCGNKHEITDADITEIQNTVLKTSKYIGYALWCSMEYKWKIKLQEFPIHEFIDKKCNIDFKKACKCIIKKSVCDVPSLEIIESTVNEKISSENFDLWQVCRGKEMLRVLMMYIKHEFKRGALRPDNLRKDFLLAFDNEDFRNTNLYVSMKDWERKNRDYSLIKF